MRVRYDSHIRIQIKCRCRQGLGSEVVVYAENNDRVVVKVPTPKYSYMTVVSDSHYQSTVDAVYVYVVPWSEFPIVPSYPHYPH